MRHPLRTSAATIALLILAGTTACSSHSSQPTAGTAGCGQVITLTLLRAEGTPPAQPVLDAWAKAHPCIKVSVSEVPFGQLSDKINISAGSPNPPDVLTYDSPDTATYAANGVLAPLDAAITPAMRADISPATLKENSYNGHIYSPGIRQSALALIYNKTMLDKLGIHPPSTLATAWTWSQAIDAMRRCQQGPPGQATVWGLAPTQSGNGTPGPAYVSLNFLRSAGDPHATPGSSQYQTFYALSPDGKTAQGWLNTPQAAKGAQLYQDIFNKYGISPKVGIPNAFNDGKACFDIQQPSFIGSLFAPGAPFTTGVTPLPYLTTPITQTGSLTLGVEARSPHVKEATEFVMFVCGAAEQLVNSQNDQSLPVLDSLFAKLPQYASYPMAIYKDELEQWGQPRPPSRWYAQYDTIVSTAMRDIAYGANVQQRLNQAAQQFDQLTGGA